MPFSSSNIKRSNQGVSAAVWYAANHICQSSRGFFNPYGLFVTTTTTRPETIIEGSEVIVSPPAFVSGKFLYPYADLRR